MVKTQRCALATLALLLLGCCTNETSATRGFKGGQFSDYAGSGHRVARQLLKSSSAFGIKEMRIWLQIWNKAILGGLKALQEHRTLAAGTQPGTADGKYTKLTIVFEGECNSADIISHYLLISIFQGATCVALPQYLWLPSAVTVGEASPVHACNHTHNTGTKPLLPLATSHGALALTGSRSFIIRICCVVRSLFSRCRRQHDPPAAQLPVRGALAWLPAPAL